MSTEQRPDAAPEQPAEAEAKVANPSLSTAKREVRSTGLNDSFLKYFCFLLPTVGLLANKGIVPLVLITSIALLVKHWRAGELEPKLDQPLMALLALCGLWFIISSAWSLSPLLSLVLACRLVILVGIGITVIEIAGQLSEQSREACQRWLVAGLLLAILIMLEERIFDFPIFKALRGDARSFYNQLSMLNRGATTVALLSWPAALYLWRKGWDSGALLLPLTLVPFLSVFESLAAVAAAVAGIVVAMIVFAAPRLRYALLIAIILIPFVFLPAFFILFDPTHAQVSALLPSTSQVRLHIWDFVADRVIDKPLIGWGLESARWMPNFDAELYGGHTRAIPIHPHNGPMQILMETGIAGGLFTLAFLHRLIARLPAIPVPEAVCTAGMITSALVISATAYGMWQYQWIAVLIACAAVMRIATKTADAGP